MPVFAFSCECGIEVELNTKADAVHVCECGKQLQRHPNLKANTFIHDRDKAPNSGSNSRYREWFKSPEVQEKIRRGELVQAGKSSNPITEHLDCLDVPASISS